MRVSLDETSQLWSLRVGTTPIRINDNYRFRTRALLIEELSSKGLAVADDGRVTAASAAAIAFPLH
jgi:hypothetical protein